MARMAAFVLFKAAGQTLALPASCVLQVLRMAAPSPVPGAPRHVRGVLNVRGRLATVIDVRARLGAASRAPHPGDRLLLVSDGDVLAALEVDEVLEVRDLPEAAFAPAQPLAPSPLVTGALRLADGVVLVHSAGAWLEGGATSGAAAAEPP